MKIIRISNYAIETEAEHLIAENIQNTRQAMVMCHALNNDPQRSDYDWFAVKPDDHVLWRGMADLAGD